MEDIFSNLTDKQLYELNKDRLKSKDEGLRPRSFDPYIAELCKVYPLDVGNAWSYAEDLFFEEVSKRFFEKTIDS